MGGGSRRLVPTRSPLHIPERAVLRRTLSSASSLTRRVVRALGHAPRETRARGSFVGAGGAAGVDAAVVLAGVDVGEGFAGASGRKRTSSQPPRFVAFGAAVVLSQAASLMSAGTLLPPALARQRLQIGATQQSGTSWGQADDTYFRGDGADEDFPRRRLRSVVPRDHHVDVDELLVFPRT